MNTVRNLNPENDAKINQCLEENLSLFVLICIDLIAIRSVFL